MRPGRSEPRRRRNPDARSRRVAATRSKRSGEDSVRARAGDVDAFNDLLGKHREAYLAQPALRAKAAFVKEKIALLAFMNLVFETPARQRALPFSAIAARARLDGDQVEWLAMRAMALGLVQGVIDEIARVVEVSWVQPRVLDPGQIRHLVEQIDTLSDKAGQSHTLIADQTAELI